jgi:oligopeptide transport system ATP-binding protein
MQDLQQEFGLSYIFISHDLSVVRHISSRIFVMYLGNIVEAGPADQVYNRPMHPYSRMLLSAVPRPDPDAPRSRAARLKQAGSPSRTPARWGAEDLPSPLNKPSGCAFRTRCPIARPECAETTPPLEERNGRQVACPFSNHEAHEDREGHEPRT